MREGQLIAEQACEARSILLGASALMEIAGVAPGELDALVVGTGPGSFTSIRIGLATARALSFALALPAAGVSSFFAFAGGRAVIDARRGEVFTAGPRVCRPEQLEVAGATLVGDKGDSLPHRLRGGGRRGRGLRGRGAPARGPSRLIPARGRLRLTPS